MAAFIGKDITLTVDSVPITGIDTFVIPTITRNGVDINPLGDDWTGKLVGNLTLGDCTGTLLYDPVDTSHKSLTDLLISGEVVTIVITYKTSCTLTFSGYVAEFGGGTAGNTVANTANFTLSGTGSATISTPA